MGDNPVIETIFGLIFLISHLIGPTLLVALPVIAAPILRLRRPVSRERRIAALLLVVLCLFWAFQLIGWVLDLGVYGIVLMAALVGSAMLTPVQERRLPAL